MTELSELYPGTLELVRSYLELGPSDESDCQRGILQNSSGMMLADDCLTEEELDAISGVQKVYTRK